MLDTLPGFLKRLSAVLALGLSGFFLDPRGGIDKTIPHVSSLRRLSGWGPGLYVLRFSEGVTGHWYVAEKDFVRNYRRNDVCCLKIRDVITSFIFYLCPRRIISFVITNVILCASISPATRVSMLPLPWGCRSSGGLGTRSFRPETPSCRPRLRSRALLWPSPGRWPPSRVLR
jgi:hypothetical protein